MREGEERTKLSLASRGSLGQNMCSRMPRAADYRVQRLRDPQLDTFGRHCRNCHTKVSYLADREKAAMHSRFRPQAEKNDTADRGKSDISLSTFLPSFLPFLCIVIVIVVVVVSLAHSFTAAPNSRPLSTNI